MGEEGTGLPVTIGVLLYKYSTSSILGGVGGDSECAFGLGIFSTGCMQKIFLRTSKAVWHLEDQSQTAPFCHGLTGSPSALLKRVLRGGVTVLEGQGF